MLKKLRERVELKGSASRAGILEGVRVLGAVSRNGRRYTEAAISSAAPKYEGVAVNLNHRNPDQSGRDVRDRFGRLRGVRLEDGVIVADLHYNPKHPFAGSFEWFAANDPAALGLSHDVNARVVAGDNEEDIVESIESVESVDIVDRPATNRGLFERFDMPDNPDDLPEDDMGDMPPDDAAPPPDDMPPDDAAPPPDDAGGDDAGADDADPETHLANYITSLLKSGAPKAEIRKKVLKALDLLDSAEVSESVVRQECRKAGLSGRITERLLPRLKQVDSDTRKIILEAAAGRAGPRSHPPAPVGGTRSVKELAASVFGEGK